MDGSPHEAGRKRRRKIWACFGCRRRKLQCDRGCPSYGRCRKAGKAATCKYADEDISKPPKDISAGQSWTRAEPKTHLPRNFKLSHDLPRADISSSLAHLERRLRLLESKSVSQYIPQEAFVPTEPQATFYSGYNDLFAACIPETDDNHVVLRGDNFQTKFHGGTFSGTLAQSIPGLKLFTRDAFAASPTLEELRQRISQSGTNAHPAGDNLHHPNSLTEKQFPRIALVESAAKMVNYHKAAISNGSQLVEALYSDHVRISLSVCLAYITIDPQSDCIITTAIEQHSFQIMNDILALATTQIRNFGGDRRHFWLTTAAIGFMQAKKDPERRAIYLQEWINNFARPYGYLLKQRLPSAMPPNGDEVMLEQMLGNNLGLETASREDLPIDELFDRWCDNMADWSWDAWPNAVDDGLS